MADRNWKHNLRDTTLYGSAAILLLGALYSWWTQTSGHPLLDDEDRPPIIVSGGSIDVYATMDHKVHDRGSWKRDGDTVYLDHGGYAPARLLVNVLHSSDCTDANYLYGASSVSIAYAASTGLSGIVELSIAEHGSGGNKKRYLTMPWNRMDYGPWTPFTKAFMLKVADDADQLKSVTLTLTGTQPDPQPPPSPVTCSLDNPLARLVIFHGR